MNIRQNHIRKLWLEWDSTIAEKYKQNFDVLSEDPSSGRQSSGVIVATYAGTDNRPYRLLTLTQWPRFRVRYLLVFRAQ